MHEHNGFEVLKWDAFPMIKLPRLFALLLAQVPGGEEQGVVHTALASLLTHSALLDTTDARCKANCFELVVRSMKHLLAESEVEALVQHRRYPPPPTTTYYKNHLPPPPTTYHHHHH